MRLHVDHRPLDRLARTVLGNQLRHVFGQHFPLDRALHRDQQAAFGNERDGRALRRVRVVAESGLEDPHLGLDHLVLARVQIIQARLQNFAQDALLAVALGKAVGPVDAQQPAAHAHEAGLDIGGVDQFDLVAAQIDAVTARGQHLPLDSALFVLGVSHRLGQHPARRQGLAAQRRDDAHLTRRNVRVHFLLGRVDDWQHEVPAFAEHVALDALLAVLGQHVAARQRLAVLGRDHDVLAGPHVDEKCVPTGPHADQRADGDHAPHDQEPAPAAQPLEFVAGGEVFEGFAHGPGFLVVNWSSFRHGGGRLISRRQPRRSAARPARSVCGPRPAVA